MSKSSFIGSVAASKRLRRELTRNPRKFQLVIIAFNGIYSISKTQISKEDRIEKRILGILIVANKAEHSKVSDIFK